MKNHDEKGRQKYASSLLSEKWAPFLCKDKNKFKSTVFGLSLIWMKSLSISKPCPQRTLVPRKNSAHVYLSWAFLYAKSKLVPAAMMSSSPLFPGLPCLFFARDSFHKEVFGMAHVVHSTNMSKPCQLRLSDTSQNPLWFKLQEEILERTSLFYLYNWCSGFSYSNASRRLPVSAGHLLMVQISEP